MLVQAENIHRNSKIYFHTPGELIKSLYLYPLCVGHYTYLPGYHLERESYPGYSLIYLKSGSVSGTCENGNFCVSPGQILFLNGYHPHSYRVSQSTEVYWLHFDGSMSNAFYHFITGSSGNSVSAKNIFHCEKLLREIYDTFEHSHTVNEPVISKYITDILTELLNTEYIETSSSLKIRESIHFMNENLGESLSVTDLAKKAYLSPYHFIRQFRKITGKTPHAYLIELRIAHAKYYLKTTEKTIKEIAFLCGFSSESSFCNTFRKRIGSTPLQYRG